MDSNRKLCADRIPDRSEIQKRVKLSAKEVRLILLLQQACTISEMAQITGMAKRTVKAHFNRIYIKFGISNRWVKQVRLLHLLNEWRER